jgi:7-carboxy-7-deazaguanine synthase
MVDINEITTLPLSKDGVFYTLQGEGRNVGKPSIFIRLAYCNLKCEWCDSFYTWQPEYVNDKEKPDWVYISTIIEEIQKHYYCKNIVITGGEPLLFQQNLLNLLSILYRKDYRIEIETNGTILPMLMHDHFYFNVSPKLSNNIADSIGKRINKEALTFFSSYERAIFKFVITKEEDWEEIREDFIIPFDIPLSKIYLMPEGKTEEELSQKRLQVVNLCLEKNVNYIDRLQINIWGTKRGV